ncbi:hypothetical protein NDU88_003357 [Pleurodeles waltl]|uniref:Uncharacterized protein n=1 Tax=Pleurodeles waltl TaxID=8319 RepID=A0AAV7VGW5_PLEWA|nr:hypothetical protein NDU88_003357 [Pleurodeles waltl]
MRIVSVSVAGSMGAQERECGRDSGRGWARQRCSRVYRQGRGVPGVPGVKPGEPGEPEQKQSDIGLMAVGYS